MPSEVPFDDNKMRGGRPGAMDTHGNAVETDTTDLGRLKGGILTVPKYLIAKSNGEAVNPEHEYWVFNISTDSDARDALRYYSKRLKGVNDRLSADLEKMLASYPEF